MRQPSGFRHDHSLVPSPALTCDDLLRLKLSLQACLARLTGTRWAIET